MSPEDCLTFEVEEHHCEASLCYCTVEVVRGQLGD